MERVTLRIPQLYIQKIEDFVKEGAYPSASELIREAIVNEFYRKLPVIRRKIQNRQQ